jgi:3',5'-cyclic-AMP phosphodiesterase
LDQAEAPAGTSGAQAGKGAPVIAIAHVSDVHIGTGERNRERARRVFAFLRDLPHPVDAVVVTGDIADAGLPQEYEIARELIDLVPFPVFTCPGNHDERRAYAAAFLGVESDGAPVNRLYRAGGAAFAMCDSTVPGQSGGFIADGTLAWLDAVLAAEPPDTPVFVGFHHPPVEVHAPFIDAMRQTGAQRLAEVLERRRDRAVKALLCGHAHTPAVTSFAGLPLILAPSLISTIRLPWDGAGVVDSRPPAGLAIHVLDDTGRLTTHFRTVP